MANEAACVKISCAHDQVGQTLAVQLTQFLALARCPVPEPAWEVCQQHLVESVEITASSRWESGVVSLLEGCYVLDCSGSTARSR
mmetsp:Transcript_44827/g.103698  ORF Transcript_44827/g.103698 Transcript_44827/m.103698 type:complete len:85 (-) Transcript_44827:33-287(-)